MLLNNNFLINLLPPIKTLQFYLLPINAFLGMALGISLGNSSFAQKFPWLTFWGSVLLNMIILKLVYVFLGDIWARLSFSFLMGYFAFSLKLLR
jgi:hypothetical protein